MRVYTLEEYAKLKKKKNGLNNVTTLENKSNTQKLGNKEIISLEENARRKNKESDLLNDIAPVKIMAGDDKKMDFFTKGAFKDGYNFGDVTKTILGTAGDAGVGLVKGVSSLGEGIADLGRYGVAGVADKLGNDTYADKVREKAQKNSVENFFKGTDEYLNEYSVLGRTSDAILQGVGQVGGLVGASIVGSAVGLGVAGATALTTAITGLSSIGSGMSEAYQGGATNEEATKYGISKGVIDAGTELIFGGLGKAVKAVGLSKGISSLDDVFAQKLSSKISNQVAKNFAEFGVKASAEGFEEVLAGSGSAVAKKLTYMEEEELSNLVKDENLLEQFVVGTVTSGMIQSGYIPGTSKGSLKEANETGKDFITGYTQNEQAVIDKEVEKRVGDQKFSKKELGEIEEQVKKDIEKGRIDIDTIENTLGGKTLEEYNKLKKESDEFNKLYTTEGYKLTEEQKDKLAQFKEKNAKNPYETALKELKDKMSQEVREATKNDTFLVESYNERERRGQKFEVDVDSYTNEYAKKTVNNFKDLGLNNSRQSHDYLDLLTKVSEEKGHSFVFMTTQQLADSKKNGNPYNIDENVDVGRIEALVNDDRKEIVINMDAGKSLTSLVGHEVMHTLENAKHYSDVQSSLFALAKERGEYDERLDSIKRRYSEMTKEQQLRELASDLMGDYIFGDMDYVKSLSVEKPNIFKKIYNEIKYLWKLANAGSSEKRKLEKVKKDFEKIWQESGNGVGETKYALKTTTDGIEYVNAEENLFLKEDGTMLSEREIFNSLVGKTFEFPDGEVKIVRRLHDKDMYNELSRRRPRYEGVEDIKQLNADVNRNMEELLANSDAKTLNEPDANDKHSNYGVASFDTRTVKFYDGKKAYDIEFTIATLKNGEKVAYAKKFFGYDDDLTKKIQTSEARSESPLNQNSVPDNSIPQNQEKTRGNEDYKVTDSGTVTKYSLATWTEETKEKARNSLIKAGHEELKVDKWINDVNSVASVIASDKARLDFEASDNQTMLKNNQEYVKTLDASTLCAKRLVYQGTFDAIQHRLPNTMLSSDDLIGLLNMMKKHGVQTPCGVCYVESRRRHLGKFAQEWLDGYKGEYKPNLDEVTTSDGLEILRKSHPETYNDFVDAMNKKGSSNPKVVQLRTEYRNEILSLTPSQIKKIDAIGGLRVQSFSDFETPHLLDMMQAVIDMSSKGLTSQAYTKVPNFAWVFGDTGIKINLSLIAEGDGFDANGNLVFSSTEGMDIDDAMALRNAYSENVGTIIVGANDKHILACMSDDRIDYIIPFHRSGWGSKELELMGMDSYEDYTYGQKEHFLDQPSKVVNGVQQYKGVKENLYPPDYWDYNVSGKENAERYLRLCAQSGREPKFSNFLVNNGDGSYSLQPDGSTDGYWKTLIDFKMYNNDGNGAKQQKVQPNFNMEEAYRVLNEYEGGANKLPVAKDVVEEFVAKYESNIAPAQYRMADDEHYASKEYGNHIYKKDLELEAPVKTTEIPKSSEDIAPVVTKNTTANYEPVEEEHIAGEDLSKKNADKIRTIQAEIKGHRFTRDITKKEFDDKIAKKQAEYDSLNRKDTKKAVDLRNQITNLETRRDSLLKSLDNKIERANNRIESIERESRFDKRRTKMQQYRELFSRLIGDTSTWKDKKYGFQYQTNTLHRNLRDIVRDENGNPDIAKADAIYDELQGSVNRNEAKKNREANRVKNVFREMKINNAESVYIQMLGELRHNPDTTLTQETVDEYYNANKGKIDTQKVDKAIEEARKLYDDLYERVNEVLREHGFKEIGYRKGYFPHFTDQKQSMLAKILNWKVNKDEIPTDIAGLTEFFEPQRTWQSFDKRRTSDVTDYNFLKGLDSYVDGSLDWIYHIGDIQKHRAFETELRYRHSSEQVQKKIDEYRNNPMLSVEEVEELIEGLTKEARNPLGNFVTDLNTRTNILAGKKSSKDRNMEATFNRHAYSVMTNINNRVTANQVVGSVSSALTNFIPITQSWGQVSPTSSLIGMKQTIQSAYRDDGMIAKSDFLTNRLAQNEALHKDFWDKAGDKVGILMEIADDFTSQTVWRSKYYENIKNGMSEAQAIKDADQFAENVIGGRSKGNMPTIFHAKNPVTKMLTAFQLEVANQYGYMFKDMPQDMANESIAKLVKGYASMFIGAYVYNALYSSLTGRDSAFDIIGILKEFIEDLTDDEEENKVAKATVGLVNNTLEEIPFVGGLLGGGRVPISSALPYDGKIQDFLDDVEAGDKKSMLDEATNLLYYGLAPMGGGQLRKTIQGASMFRDDLPVSGSYTKSGNLRFPVEETFLNVLQGHVFGQYANKNAREYFDRELAPLNKNQIQEYKELDIPISDYWDYLDGKRGLSTNEEKTEHINSLDLPIDKKNILLNNVLDRKEKVDMTGYEDFSGYEEFDFYTKNTEKYEFLQSIGVSYDEYTKSKESKEAYNWAYQYPEKYAVSKAVTDDVTVYKQYISEINDIEGGKENVKNYIFSLNMDYGQQAILYRSMYGSKDDKNEFDNYIVNYLNSRNDLSDEEKRAILNGLK